MKGHTRLCLLVLFRFQKTLCSEASHVTLTTSSLTTWLIIVCGVFKDSTAQPKCQHLPAQEPFTLKPWSKGLTWLRANLRVGRASAQVHLSIVPTSGNREGVRRLHPSLVELASCRKPYARVGDHTPHIPSDWSRLRSAPARWG